MQQSAHGPVTPVKDPAAIDRRGLVGVGELATPRWVRGSRKDARSARDVDDAVAEVEEGDVDGRGDDAFVDAQDGDPDFPDSPWTIEAIDGEQDEEAVSTSLRALSLTCY